MKPSTPAAIEAVQEAMRLVEEAQHTLERACSVMSPVRRGVRGWQSAGKLALKARAVWDQLRDLSKRPGLSLDSEPEP